ALALLLEEVGAERVQTPRVGIGQQGGGAGAGAVAVGDRIRAGILGVAAGVVVGRDGAVGFQAVAAQLVAGALGRNQDAEGPVLVAPAAQQRILQVPAFGPVVVEIGHGA